MTAWLTLDEAATAVYDMMRELHSRYHDAWRGPIGTPCPACECVRRAIRAMEACARRDVTTPTT